VCLPEREVALVLLARVRLLLGELVELLVREPSVLGEASDAEVDVAVDLVREAAGDQLLDQRDLLGDRPLCRRLVVRPPEAEVVRVLEVPLRRVARELRARPRRGVVDLVVDVGEVLDERDLVALELEPALQPGGEDERPRVPDVDARVERRPAEVHPDRARR
jgi:hypothetical protein